MERVKTNSLQAWVLAARPKTLTGALVPVVLATALAAADGVVRVPVALLCALFAAAMQVAANLINDYYDWRKGSDRADRLGPERACAQGWITPRAMLWGIAATLGVACLGFGLPVWHLVRAALPWGGGELLLLGALCVVFAFAYTAWFSYWGLGDVLVLVFFGFVPVGGTYYVQALSLTPEVAVLSLVSGLAIDALLVINNYRDREQDLRSGKRTVVVRWGEPFGRWLYLALGLVVVALMGVLWVQGRLTPLGLAGAAVPYGVLHFGTWRRLCAIRRGRALNALLGQTSRNMALLALLLSAALLAAAR